MERLPKERASKKFRKQARASKPGEEEEESMVVFKAEMLKSISYLFIQKL